ncbi:Oidioi.mRNA.OKI2018_I69.PAR.g11267.t2.cds [Oikopleura dioica]|uniref:Oidioi.mRNA.OKI2018_I69.PAR.g11267.t2.cds n=1 Tax=Oikopleura dioica TaxID=34765 RepID=A0ABN7RZN9_OIKDI|nr:Oidioi.mRNA.OKI2018_I69.PAR.g11267.t2.cds [Oikopleura dioica]
MGYTEVHTLDQRIRDAQLMLKKLKEYRNAARRYTTPAVSNKCSKSNKKAISEANQQIQMLERLIRSAEKTPVRFGMANYTDLRAHNAKKKRNAKNAPDPSAAFFNFKGAKTPEEGATLGNRLFAAAANVGDALSDMVARAAGPLAEEPLDASGTEDETVVLYQSESDHQNKG